MKPGPNCEGFPFAPKGPPLVGGEGVSAVAPTVTAYVTFPPKENDGS